MQRKRLKQKCYTLLIYWFVCLYPIDFKLLNRSGPIFCGTLHDPSDRWMIRIKIYFFNVFFNSTKILTNLRLCFLLFDFLNRAAI